MRFRFVAVGVLLAGLSAAALHAQRRPEDTQFGVVRSYLAARAASMQVTAGPADVERVLDLCTPTVLYEHPRAGVTRTGVEALRDGMRSFLGTTRKASIAITGSLQGRDMVAVETAVSFEAKDGDTWVPVSRPQTWVFEFDGTKIRRIIEYW
jgi:hypothetical protein